MKNGVRDVNGSCVKDAATRVKTVYFSANTLLMHKRNYTINGINPETGRSNKRRVKAFDEKGCRILAMTVEALVEPIEIITVSDDSPFENQLSYARHLGIEFPASITQQELSDLISFRVENDEAATESLKKYGVEVGAEFSNYIGARILSDRILSALLSNNEQRIAFYLWVVYNLVNGSEITSLNEAVNKQIFYDFGKEMASDGKFLQSFDNEIRNGRDDSFSILFTDSYLDHFAQSRAYSLEKAKNYLRYKFKIERWRMANVDNKKLSLEDERAYQQIDTAASGFSYKDAHYNTGRGAMPQLPKSQAKCCAPVVLLLLMFVIIVALVF